MKTGHASIVLTASMDSLVAAHDDVFARAPTPLPARVKPADYRPCPTTLTKTGNGRLDRCTTTIFERTRTEGVDRRGCRNLVTTTTYPILFGVGPACVGGQKTVSDAGTTTVTSCKATSTAPSAYYPPEATK
ncbi:hypothetical protein CLAFUW4_12145 [Fulvia fulva]|uniref:Uncharacterized protein n=1 Tax=Passalora fulva TaxID=5499 RepID=A0A9Q8PDM9_PASFU|nr:uncharacterized protein CLAFUR5_11184 [Fulvia fulva]KAK4618093.1 hypothetical protein CLAFUR4_12150 [Fulvia fulva]KAK4619064.1 hypothetical protein CLAFUR0_12161 [Fulvia fulva]UJO20520.1 hypothetical protein CLAFUR5_11184 [Fulvia fulva]WPV18284.1 hypothetical protein CLAFUW4_12145 [Fulvia fulva]WPV32892.1 hypothetical protein CLAFUW7_12152 [Fulvia fulva]